MATEKGEYRIVDMASEVGPDLDVEAIRARGGGNADVGALIEWGMAWRRLANAKKLELSMLMDATARTFEEAKMGKSEGGPEKRPPKCEDCGKPMVWWEQDRAWGCSCGHIGLKPC